MEKNSTKFTKYRALDNYKNKDDVLILWRYEKLLIYTPDKKNPIKSEYFIWNTKEIISRGRISLYYFFDGTWYMSKGYGQLFIILFKDIITKEKPPSFYVLMPNRLEELYKKVFSSKIEILTQNYIYTLLLICITTDTEYALINGIKSIFMWSKTYRMLVPSKSNLE